VNRLATTTLTRVDSSSANRVGERIVAVAHRTQREPTAAATHTGMMIATASAERDWGAAYARHADAVYRLARCMLGNPDDAADVVQTVFERAVQHGDRYDASRPLEPWLLGIASHEALHLARRRRVRSWVAFRGTEQAPDPAWRAEAVWDAVAALPPGHRAVVVLFYLHGYSIEEIGDLLGVAAGTVGSRLHTARQRLRVLVETTLSEAPS
jgi:RNA polymerase sigma-70 factor, ECF subfamily